MLFNIARFTSTLTVLSVSALCVLAAPVKIKKESVVMSELVKRAPTATIITSCTLPGQVALTYDDGPSVYTQELIDYLNSKNALATFFVNGNNNGRIEDHAAAVRSAYQSGHQIASHTYSHQDLNTLSDDEIGLEMSQLDTQIKNIIGWRPLFVRPPYGNANQHVVDYLTERGYYVTNWDIDSNDWQHLDNIPASMAEYTAVLNTPSAKSKGYIALHHDTYASTVEELTPRVVEYLQGAGYALVTVGHCLGLNQTQWYRA
ncbi:Carbohydrate esterase 4 protein [Actinomortierella ambigua]|nr:Carbohydrate esterase 4 protein [Actinomortierella ambigua]